MDTTLSTIGKGLVTVALVEDDDGTRERLSSAIESANDLVLLFAAGSAAQAIDGLQKTPPDVLLVDLGLPDASGLDVIHSCRALSESTLVMVITMFGDDESMIKAIEAGARGYLLKGKTEPDLARSVIELKAGGSPMSPVIARRLLERFRPNQSRTAQTAGEEVATLTPREMQVLQLLTKGYTYEELGGLLGITRLTVHSHVKNIYGKLAVHSRVEALFEARQLGLLD